ncbi:MAG: DNA mismatch repair endonuclease MutL [Limisphaerales bacterium]
MTATVAAPQRPGKEAIPNARAIRRTRTVPGFGEAYSRAVNRIRLLPEHVANQIAAGEVVERPASVIKELVENALDAQATRITVEIQAGGRSLLRVTDDGTGMGRDDALMAFERHATSKIQRAEDLAAITTMGFRGEALPSIASVSRLLLTTRERHGDAIEATQITFHGGKLLDVRSASGPTGTAIEVRQLFFNLPARRKFLRSEETERAHIQHYLTLAALGSPGVGFTFLSDGRTLWQLPPVPSPEDGSGRLTALRERLRALYGADLNLLPVDFAAELHPAATPEDEDFRGPDALREQSEPRDSRGTFRVWGFIGAPGVSRSTREDQHLFVNRRPIEHRGLNFALLEGYHTALMKGRYPVCCLFLEIDPALVDVNIHPSKREVKFREERQVRGLVARAVQRTLLGYHTSSPAAAKPAVPETPVSPPSGTPASPGPDAAPVPGFVTEPELVELFRTPPTSNPPPTLPRVPEAWRRERPSPANLPAPVSPASSERPEPASDDALPSATPESAPAPLTASGPVPSPLPAPGAGGLPAPLLSVPLRLVGVIGRLYVVLESDRGLVLLDQHAAHERILFEQMLVRLERNDAPSQRLLLPETVELSARDAQFLREILPTLIRLGVGLAEFGERTYLLDALPPFVRVSDARRFVLELVDELKAAGEDVNALRLGEHTVAKTVCRHAVKANDPLQGRELENLVEDLRRCTMPYTCPHGRPTLIELSYRELEKKFGRAQ